MSDTFDPYYEWLGIRPKDQPPNHYRLLGLDMFEEHLNVIERAADRQMAHVRTFQAGRHARDSQRLLNELAAARLCLLTPEKKQQYDAQLRREVEPTPAGSGDPSKLTFDGTFGGEALPPIALPGAPQSFAQPMPLPQPAQPLPHPTPVPGPQPAPLASRAEAPAKAGPGVPPADFRPNDAPATRVLQRVKRRRWWQQPALQVMVLGLVAAGVTVYFLFVKDEGGTSPSPPAPAQVEPAATSAAPEVDETAEAGDGSGANTPVTLVPGMYVNEADATPADPVSTSAWPDAPDDLVERLAMTEGQLSAQFAYCQTMDWKTFLQTTAALRQHGYRPVRVRPYVHVDNVQVAAIWWRDGRAFRIVGGVAADAIADADQKLADRFRPVDVASWIHDGDRHVAVWVERQDGELPRSLTVATPKSELPIVAARQRARGFLPETHQVSIGRDGQPRYSQIWIQAEGGEWYRWEVPAEAYVNILANLSGTPTDLSLYIEPPSTLTYAGCALGASRGEFLELHGKAPSELRSQASAYGNRGYLPVALAVSPTAAGEDLVAATIWQTPSAMISPDLAALPAAEVAPAGQTHALRFRGREHVEIPDTRGLADANRAFTAEVWLRLAAGAPSPGHYFLGNGVMRGFHPEVRDTGLAGWLLMVQAVDGSADQGMDTLVFRVGTPGGTSAATARVPPLLQGWHHVALSNEPLGTGQWRVRVFLDGQLVVEKEMPADAYFPSPANLHLGTAPQNSPGLQFHGDIKAFRLSSTARYQEAFDPEQRFAADAATLVLFDFSGGESGRIEDLSGLQHHGQVEGPQWLELREEGDQAAAGPQSRQRPRQAVPDPTALRKAQAQVDQDYKDLIAAAKTKPALINVAGNLLDDAAQADDPALRYKLLETARDVGVAAVDPRLAQRALDELGEHFEIALWHAKAEMAQAMQSSARNNADRQIVAEMAIALAGEAALAEAFDAAAALVQVARRSTDPKVKRLVTELQRQLALEKRLHQAADEARQKLAADPADKTAHTAMGKYLAFVREDWESGLSHLARGDDAALAEIARADQAGAADPAAQVALAERWSDWAKASTGTEQPGALARAHHWYSQAASGLSGSEKEAVQAKLQALAANLLPRRRTDATRLSLLDGDPGYVRRFSEHTGAVLQMDASRSGNWFISASADNTVRVWDLATGEHRHEIPQTVNGVRGVCLMPDDAHAVVAGSSGVLEIWEVATGRPVPPGIPVEGPTQAISAAANGRHLLWARLARPTNELILIDLATRAPVGRLPSPGIPTSVALSSSGQLAAAVDQDRRVHAWKLAGGVRHAQLSVMMDPLMDVAISPDERHLAACTQLECVIWDAATGQEVHRLTLGDELFARIAFSRDSRRLVTTGRGNQLSVWDVQQGKRLERLTQPTGDAAQPSSLLLLPDPRGALVGTTDGSIHLWRLPE